MGMKTDRLLHALIGCLALLGVYPLMHRESYTTPADEMKEILPVARQVVDMQRRYFQAKGEYASVAELMIMAGVDVPENYTLEVESDLRAFRLVISPEHEGEDGGSRRLSVYADESGIIRYHYGPGRASGSSRAVPQNWITARRFWIF